MPASRTVGLSLVLVVALAWLIARFGRPPSPDPGQSGSPFQTTNLGRVEGTRGVLDSHSAEAPSRALVSASAEPRASRTVVVRVQGPASEPVEGAEVFFYSTEAAASDEKPGARSTNVAALGVTGANGELELSSPARVSGAWRAERQGLVAAERAWRAGDDRVELTLRAARNVVGRVAWADASPTGSDVSIVGWPRRVGASGVDWSVLRTNRNPLGCTVTRADERGEFTLDGLDSEVAYELIAIGPSAFSISTVNVPPDNDAHVQLQIHAVYGLSVALRQSDGTRLLTNPRLYGVGPAWSVSDPGARESLLALPPWARALSDRWVRPSSPPNAQDVDIFFTTPDPREWIDGIHYEVTAPGYVPVATVLRAPRLKGEGSVQTIEAIPVSACWGTLRTSIVGAGLPPIRPGDPPRTIGTIQVQHESGALFSFQLRQTESSDELLNGIPCGRYTARYRALTGGFAYPRDDASPLAFDIWSGERQAQLSIDLTGSGSLVLDLRSSNGEPYTRWASIEVLGARYPSEGARSYVSFEQPPYIIGPLLPSEYFVRAVRYIGGGSSELQRALLPVVDSEVIFAELDLGDGL